MATVTECSNAAPNIKPDSEITSKTSPKVETNDEKHAKLPELKWMVQPCFVYKDEYDDCKSFKAKFHQYFIHGKTLDCSQWKNDYESCRLWEDKEDVEALKKVIEGEKSRIRHRLKNHYANDVWEQRTFPPPDWNKPLPESIRKSYEGTLLQLKSEALKKGEEKLQRLPDETPYGVEKSFCAIM